MYPPSAPPEPPPRGLQQPSTSNPITSAASPFYPMLDSSSNADLMSMSFPPAHPMTAPYPSAHPMTASTPNAHPMTASTTDIHDMNDSLLKQLECPVCFETCLPPIFMCVNGHNICNSCRDQMEECSICRYPGVPTSRNRFAEDISAKVKLPCPNKTDGCALKFNTKDLEEHLQTCEQRFKYTCVLDELTNDPSINDYAVVWHGCRANLIQHVRQKHPYSFSENVCTDMQRLIGYSDFRHTDVKLISVFGQLFWVMMFSDRKTGVELVPYYIGHHGNEKSFECKMEVSTQDGDFRVTCFAPVYNWSDGNVTHANIFRLKEKMVLAMLNKDVLTVRVTIVKK